MAISISLDGDEGYRDALRRVAEANRVEIGKITRAALDAFCGNQIETAVLHSNNLQQIRKELIIDGFNRD